MLLCTTCVIYYSYYTNFRLFQYYIRGIGRTIHSTKSKNGIQGRPRPGLGLYTLWRTSENSKPLKPWFNPPIGLTWGTLLLDKWQDNHAWLSRAKYHTQRFKNSPADHIQQRIHTAQPHINSVNISVNISVNMSTFTTLTISRDYEIF